MRLVLVLLSVAGCASTTWRPTWAQAEYVADGVAIGTLACDGGTTEQYLRDSQWRETNPLLGSDPGSLRLWTYLGAVGLALIGVNHLIGHKAGTFLALAVAAFEIAQPIRVNVGVGASPCGLGAGGPWKQLPVAPAAR